jgi:hypothetical protein
MRNFHAFARCARDGKTGSRAPMTLTPTDEIADVPREGLNTEVLTGCHSIVPGWLPPRSSTTWSPNTWLAAITIRFPG